MGNVFEVTALPDESPPRLPKLHVDPATGAFADDLGRRVTLRGINSVVKHPPWYDPKMLDQRYLSSKGA